MYATLLNIHKIVVILFFLIYVIKTILLLSNKTELLQQLTKKIKVPEMIISTAFLVTGVWLLLIIPEVKTLLIVKIVLVFLSIPLAVIGFKKSNKILAALSLLMITASYGLAEMSKKRGANSTMSSNAGLNSASLFESNCAKCHGPKGEGGIGSNLTTSVLNASEISSIILEGKGAMEAISMEKAQADSIAAFVFNNLEQKNNP